MTMRGTVLRYGTVTISNCQTTRFSQEAVYDQHRVDLVGYKYTISVVGYVHAFGDAEISTAFYPQSPDPNVENATDAWWNHQLKGALMTPRQDFAYWIGGIEQVGQQLNRVGSLMLAVESPSAGANALELSRTDSITDPWNHAHADQTIWRDTHAGPKPIHCNIQQITGNAVFRVEFTIELNVTHCDAGQSGNKSGVLSNKWSCTDAIDDNFYTTRTVQGRVTLWNPTFNAHSFREFAVPRLQPGMRRQSMHFAASADGLSLDYTVTDKEVAFAAPYPATRWHMNYTESTSLGSSLTATGALTVQLEAPRDVDRAKLLQLAAAIAEARLRMKADKDAAILESLVVHDEYGTDVPNRIRLEGRVKRVPKGAKELANIISKQMGTPINAADLGAIANGYDPSLSFGARGGDPVFLSGPIKFTTAWGCYLQSPCSEAHEVQLADRALQQRNPAATQATESVTATVVTSLPDQTLASDLTYGAEDDSLYTHWEYESKVQTDHHMVQCPIADRVSYSGGTTSKATCVIAPVAQPTAQRIVRIRGQRIGKRPELPKAVKIYSFGTGNPKPQAVLKRDTLVGSPPRLSADRKKIYDAAGEYVYLLTQPIDDSEEIDVGFNPFSGDAKQQKLKIREGKETP